MEEIAEDIAGNVNGISVTATQLNSIDGVSGAVEGVEYSVALQGGTFVDPDNPTAEEIQKVINMVNAIENLIEKGEINLDLKDIAFIRTTEQMTPKDAKSLREEFQYGTETAVNEKLLKDLLDNAKKIVERVEIALNEL